MSRAADVVVIGAGVFGLAVALRLARAGIDVRVLDQAQDGAFNASAVAAGMLAPVSETLAEAGDAEHLRRLMVARDLWPAFAASIPGIALEASGMRIQAADAEAFALLLAKLSALGVEPRSLDPRALGVSVADDWRLDAASALSALRAALTKLGVGVEAAAVSASPSGELHVDECPLEAERVIIAAGYGAKALAAAAPELAALSPIKGQLTTFAPGGPGGAMQRGGGVYLAPQPSGARAGATMEAGRFNLDVEPATVERMRDAAVALSPELAGLAYRGEAGVRAATPDGWPLVGPSVTPGVLLATGARRNGWLLAPLVSQMILDAVTGAPAHALAGAFHPGRFTR